MDVEGYMTPKIFKDDAIIFGEELKPTGGDALLHEYILIEKED